MKIMAKIDREKREGLKESNCICILRKRRVKKDRNQ